MEYIVTRKGVLAFDSLQVYEHFMKVKVWGENLFI